MAPPARTWGCSITTKPGLETVLLSVGHGPSDTSGGLTPPATADHYTYAALGTATFTGTGIPSGFIPFGSVRYGLINNAGEFVIVNSPHAAYAFDFGGENDPPSGGGQLNATAGAVDTLVASVDFGTTWRWAVVENEGPAANPPTDATPVCTSAPFTVPTCPDANSDGTCPYHAATPPAPLTPPAWTCSITTTVTPTQFRGPFISVTITFGGTVNGIPVERLSPGPRSLTNYPAGSTIGQRSHDSFLLPGSDILDVFQDPWSFTPVCSTPVTVPPTS